MSTKTSQLLESLVESELLSNEQAEETRKKLEVSDKPLEDILVEEGYISDENLGQIIADYYKVPFVDLKKIKIRDDILQIIPEVVAKKQRIIAFDRGKDGLKIAMVDPENEEMIRFISKKTGDPVIPYYSTNLNISEALQLYRKGIKEEFKEIIDTSVKETQEKPGADRELPVTRIVDTILEYAYYNKASDIHIEPHDKKIAVRFRIDGVLHDLLFLPKNILQYIVTRVKIISRLRTDEHRSAQDGKFQVKYEKKKVDIRVSIVPVSDGEKIVMRLLSEKSRRFGLPDLGLAEKDLEIVTRNFQKPYGMILATGPTGSGKTTTLYAILKILNTRKVNISTIEDPIEYDIEGVNQIQVNPQTNLVFASGLRSILRQDPDIIMVGEIRDEETAGIAINSAMTGHLVLSTLHTNDAPTTLPRLLDMEIEPFLVASTVNVAIGQRLVRKIHQGCMESYLPDSNELEQLNRIVGPAKAKELGLSKEGIRLYRGKGCELCHNTGYEGRIGIFEVLEMNENIRKLVMDRTDSDTLRTEAIKGGMTTMFYDGINKVIQGTTTLEEVLRATKE